MEADADNGTTLALLSSLLIFLNLLLRFLRAKRIPTREKKKEFFVVKIPLPFVFILAGLINMEPENFLVESVVA